MAIMERVVIDACDGIEVTEGMTTEVSPLQPENAPAPIEVTDEGMTTEVRESKSWNALSSMLVTESGIITEETRRSFIARARSDTFSDECIKILRVCHQI